MESSVPIGGSSTLDLPMSYDLMVTGWFALPVITAIILLIMERKNKGSWSSTLGWAIIGLFLPILGIGAWLVVNSIRKQGHDLETEPPH